MRVWKNVVGIFALLALLTVPLDARQAQEPLAHVTLQGIVRTGDNVPVPGASVHIVEQISGKSWVTWTDEQGKFRLPELPGGKFRIEATQIGFGLATVEVTPTVEKGPDIILSLHIATMSEIAAANASATTPPVATAPATTPPNADAKTQPASTTPPPASGAQTGTGAKPGTTPTTTARGGRGNQPGQGQQGGRGGGRGFQQVDVSGQGGADPTDPTGTAGAGDPLGGTQAATADAVLASGTIAQGFSGGGLNMQFGGGFDQNNANSSQAGQTGTLNAGGGDLPGGVPGGIPGGGGPGGGGRGGPGGGGPGGGGARGGGGGGDRGGRGGGRGAQGANGPPWGLSNVIRKRINTMHYTLNETLADSAFDANNWSATGTVQPKVPWVTNNFGGSLGGPLRIPKVYDGRDKTYFFINAQFGHGTTGVNNYSNVPTAEESVGNFCNSGTGGTPLLLYDFTSNFNGPRTLLPVPGNCNLQGQINPHTGLPYVSPVSTALLGFVPSPNLPAGSQFNYLLQATTPTNSQSVNIRVNQTISPKLNLGVVYNIRQGQSSGQGAFPQETTTSSSRGQNVTVTLNHNISTRLINSIALNFTRQRTNSLNGFANVTDVEGNLGITGVGNTNPLNWGLPGISFNSTGGLPYTGFNDALPSLRKNETWNLSDTVSYTLPKHTLHFGFTYRRVQLNNVFDPNPRGSFNFNGLLTENFAPNATTGVEQPIPGTGSSMADFEMGLPAGTNVRFGDTFNYLRTYGFIAYATDDWHVYPRLTVTYGLRYELMLPPSELFGHIANLDVSPTFNQVSVVVPCTSGITPCGTGQFSGALPNSLIHANYLNFAPRVAIAWRVPGKWFDANNGRHALTVRAGYSIVDITSTYNGLDSSLLNQPPFATVSSFSTASAQLLTLQNGFPGPAGVGVNTIAVNPNYKNPYTQIWNLSLESQIIDGLVWQLTYVGTKGTHLDLFTAPNVLSTTSPALLGQPIPQQLAFTYDTSGGNLEYNGMQARLQKRMRQGFTFTALYTFSKSIDDSSSIGGSSGTVIQQFPLFQLERGLSTFDTRHSITGNSTFELPFGQRKRWAHTGTQARLFGNFRLSGSATFHTGTPLTPIVQGALTQYASGNFQTRPDVLPGCNPNLSFSQQAVTSFINTSCFAAPGGTFPNTSIVAPGNIFGDAGRDTITGPSMFNVNMALQRTITLDRDGQKHLDLRWEVNNLANHPNWSGLGLVVGTRNFGQITGAGGMRTMTAVIRLNF